VAGTGTAGDPYLLTSADTSDGSETNIDPSATVNVAGTGTTANPYVLTATAGDGTETIVNGSATVSINGLGSTGNPYIPSIPNGAITTSEILNRTVLNEDIAPGAAIDGSKINPNFTSGITTTGGLSVGADIFLNGFMVQPDYVFQKYFLGNSILDPNYEFKKLSEIEDFIKQNKHLPGVQSEAAIKEQGFWNLGEASRINLEKIEELFLHTIEQEKKIKALESANQAINTEMEALKTQMEEIKKMLVEKKQE
jgi:hypothetical protein